MFDPLSGLAVKTLVPIHIFGLDISLTNSALFMLFVVFLICLFMSLGTKKGDILPSKLQFIIESLFFFIGDLTKTNIGPDGAKLFPYVLSVFMFILFGNIIGLFPFSFSFTSQIAVTFSLALIVFITSIIIGLVKQKGSYFQHFCPEGIPKYLIPFFILIESISFLFRPVSLGVRLFANMVSGHIMLEVIASFAVPALGAAWWVYGFSIFPIVINVFLNMFKVIVCILQAYVFVVLSCIYLSESIQTKHN